MRSSLSAIDYSGVVNRDTILVVDVRALTDRNFDFRQSASKNPSFKCLRVCRGGHATLAISGDGEQMGACRSTKYRPIGAKYALIRLLGRSVLVPTCVGDD